MIHTTVCAASIRACVALKHFLHTFKGWPELVVFVYSSLIRVLPHTGQVPRPLEGSVHNDFPRLFLAISYPLFLEKFLLIPIILQYFYGFTEAQRMNDFPFPQEFQAVL